MALGKPWINQELGKTKEGLAPFAPRALGRTLFIATNPIKWLYILIILSQRFASRPVPDAL